MFEDPMTHINLKVNGSGNLDNVVYLISTDQGGTWYQIAPKVFFGV